MHQIVKSQFFFWFFANFEKLRFRGFVRQGKCQEEEEKKEEEKEGDEPKIEEVDEETIEISVVDGAPRGPTL